MPARLRGAKRLRHKFGALGKMAQGRAIERALVAGGLIVQNDAKRKAPYRTGNLRRSIHIGGHEDLNPGKGKIDQTTGEPVPAPKVSGNEARIYVGTDVEYASSVEFGMGSRPPKPYLRPAMDENRREVGQEVANALRDLIEAAI